MKRFLFCLLVFISFIKDDCKAQVIAQDSLALVDFYYANNFSSNYNVFWMNGDVSNWSGITVSNSRVTGIDLNQLSVSQIPNSFGNLTGLKTLNLANCGCSDTLRTSFENLRALSYLDLSGNYLKGNVIGHIEKLTSLSYLDLSSTPLFGNTITNAIDSLINITHINFNNDGLTGTLDPFLKLTKLDYLSLSSNSFSGRIPSMISNLTNLTFLDLSFNKLIDSLPSAIGSLSNLTYLDLNYNQFYLTIPSSIGNLVKLNTLVLSYNQLTGSIPSSLSNLTNLQTFELDNNQLTGSFPEYIENFTQLISVYLNNNKLTGNIPTNIGNLIKLYDGQFGNNLLTGSIPTSMGNLSNASFLTMDHNQLTGSIPLTFKNLTKIFGLGITYNQLSGSVAILGEIPNIEDLYADNNNFTFDGMDTLLAHPPKNLASIAPQNNISIHSNNNVLSVNAGGNLSDNIYKWYNGTQLVVIKYGDSTFTPTTKGTYSVQVTNSIAVGLVLIGTAVTVTTVEAQLCPSGSSLVSDVTGSNYQWQVDMGSGFTNINDNSNYTGTHTGTLQFINMPAAWYGYHYRALVDNISYSTSFTIQFTNTWTGMVDSDWSNGANWSCGSVPDANTDAIINSGTVVLSSNASVRSLTVNPTASFTVVPPFNLTITH